MSFAWRLVAERRADTAFTGEGSFRESARWHHAGHRCIYVASSLALAALEVLVHSGGGRPVRPYVSFRVDIPDELEVAEVPTRLLGGDWRRTPPPSELRDFGTDWIQLCACAVLRVPSAVSPADSNFLLNPTHPDFTRISIAAPEPFTFDERLLIGENKS